jgi:hypothetical protein
VFDGAAWDRLKYQLDCPLHLQRLPQPTTLHTLLTFSAQAFFSHCTLPPERYNCRDSGSKKEIPAYEPFFICCGCHREYAAR